MKVLLIKDVKSLGKAGDVKEVKDGYGRNFLIAKGFAKLATDEVIKEYQEKKAKEEKEKEEELKRLKELAKKLDKLEIVITKKAGENGHIFGAVTKDEIAEALKKQHNIEIDKKHITDKKEKAIKSIGEHEVDLKLGNGIHATLHVDVVGEK